MQRYKKTDDLSTFANHPPPQHDPDAQVRQVLAYGTLFLVFFTLVIYLLTRDVGIFGRKHLSQRNCCPSIYLLFHAEEGKVIFLSL